MERSSNGWTLSFNTFAFETYQIVRNVYIAYFEYTPTKRKDQNLWSSILQDQVSLIIVLLSFVLEDIESPMD